MGAGGRPAQMPWRMTRLMLAGGLAAMGAILLAVPAAAQDRAQGSPNGAFSSDANTAVGQTPTKAHPLDLNAASAAELAALPGVGTARSKAIVDGRPYRVKDELVRRKILPQNVYDQVKDLVVIKQG